MKVGSLCTGIGGLDLAVGGDLRWVSEIDRRATEVLAYRFPGAPNIGDWTTTTPPEEVDLITAGLPCQPLSHAGHRRGDEDERYLFDNVFSFIQRLPNRPVLFFENVPGFRTIQNGEPFRRFVDSIASLGYVLSWGVLPASSVGAPHRRSRWWCVAAHPDGPTQRPQLHSPQILDQEEGITRKNLAGLDMDRDWVSDIGPYEQAVRRWERIMNRHAPYPLEERRLAPTFVEWMMGYPEGWVTSLPLSRSAQLKLLGNAVVPLQATTAFRLLEERL